MSEASASYGQFCPVARATEILAGRWTPLVLRELLGGCRRFNDFRRGLPQMSPTLLSRRLRELEEAQVLERRAGKSSPRVAAIEYWPTPAAEELRPLLECLGTWGQRWAAARIRSDDCEPDTLMWLTRRYLRVPALPRQPCVLLYQFSGVPARRRNWWIVVEKGAADLCLKDPRRELDVLIAAPVEPLVRIYLGQVEPAAAVRAGRVRVSGASEFVRSFPRWCARSRFAGVKPARAA